MTEKNSNHDKPEESKVQPEFVESSEEQSPTVENSLTDSKKSPTTEESPPAEESPHTEESPPAEEIPAPDMEQPTEESAAEEELPAQPESGPVITPEAEKVIRVDTLQDEPEYSPEEFARLVKLYEGSLTEIKEGSLVQGRIVALSEKEVAIDIGFKAEGVIPLDEFDDKETLKIGEEIDVFLDKVEDKEGQLVLSKRKADFVHTWDRMMEAYRNNEIVHGEITRRIKGGMVVDLMKIDAFLPGSQIDIHPIRDFDALVGQEMDFRIVKINELRKNIVLSHKVLLEESLAEVRSKKLSEMFVGQILEGTVKNITDFGVFVDLGGVDGLLHITDLSWGRINHPSEVVGLDDKITVKVIDYDLIRKRISIGYKQLQPHPWEGVEERYPLNSKVSGKVVSITNYGAFVELERGVEGLIHISEMSWTQHIKHPSSLLSIGDEVEIMVLSLDVEERKISLGLKQVEPDPWEALAEKYVIGSTHSGFVRDLMPFGAFVELEDGIEGLVHISDLSWTKKVRHPGEIVKKSDQIDVVILGFDRNERRIALGYKQTQVNPWDHFKSQYAVKTLTTGKIVRLIDKGIIVELPLEVEGFVPNSQLGRDADGPIRKRLKPGDTLELMVAEFDKDAKRIVLSATEVRKLAERASYEKYKKAKEEAETDKESKVKDKALADAEADIIKEEEADKPAKAKKPKKKPQKKPTVEDKKEIDSGEAEEKPAEAIVQPSIEESTAPEPAPPPEKPSEKPEQDKPVEDKPVEKKTKKPKPKSVKKEAPAGSEEIETEEPKNESSTETEPEPPAPPPEKPSEKPEQDKPVEDKPAAKKIKKPKPKSVKKEALAGSEEIETEAPKSESSVETAPDPVIPPEKPSDESEQAEQVKEKPVEEKLQKTKEKSVEKESPAENGEGKAEEPHSESSADVASDEKSADQGKESSDETEKKSEQPEA